MTKMEEGETYAIETFGSTGRGRVVEGVGLFLLFASSELSRDQGETSHYALVPNAPNVPLRYCKHALVCK
jgi:methionyl aminopeptidase